MAGFKASISKTFGKANDFIADKQKQYRLQQSLDNENIKLSSLFNELGKCYYYGTPISGDRTANVIKDDISQTLNTIEALKMELVKTSATV